MDVLRVEIVDVAIVATVVGTDRKVGRPDLLLQRKKGRFDRFPERVCPI